MIRRLLIIGVGSSANTHLLRKIAEKYPSLLFNNELVMIETSADVLGVAIQKIYEVYKKNYRYTNNRENIIEPYKFKEKLTTKNSILLAKEGGESNPDIGLGYYSQQASKVIERISDIFVSNRLSGVIVIGSAGKGTGTLITPALVRDLHDELNRGILGFITLPFRTHKTEIENAKKMINFITSGGAVPSDIPLFMIDYEAAFDIYLYRSRKSKKSGMPRIGDIYKIVVDPLSLTISNIIEALNFAEYCSPPLDWSDLSVLFSTPGIGTLMFSMHNREEDLLNNWRTDLEHQRFLRTSVTPVQTNAVTILRSGAGVPIKLIDDISDYYSRSLNVSRHSIYILEYGTGYLLTTLISGIDARTISPEIEHKRYSWWQRLRGG